MGLRMSKGFVVGSLSVLLVAGATNAGQYYLWDKKLESTKVEYEERMALLQQTLDAVGELTDAYTVLVEGKAGGIIEQDNLVLTPVAASTIGDSYVLDPATVVGKYYKVDVKPGTPLTSDLVMDTVIDDTSREADLVANIWPVGLKVGDYIDVELIYPSGEVFTVVSKLRVNGITGETIKVVANRYERYLYDSALVDYYLSIADGSQIRFVKYTEPGVQKAAEIYYSVPKNVSSVMSIDPNIVEEATASIQSARRTIIDATMDAILSNRLKDNPTDYATGVQSVQAKLQEAYEAYLENLGVEAGTQDSFNTSGVEGVMDEQLDQSVQDAQSTDPQQTPAQQPGEVAPAAEGVTQ